MPPALQVKLLRALQERAVQPLGATEPRAGRRARRRRDEPRSRAERQRRARFREDLYYRLNVVPLAMPPLRDRRDDIAAALPAFPRRAAALRPRAAGRSRPSDARHLARHAWPGNVRELDHFAERCALGLAPG